MTTAHLSSARALSFFIFSIALVLAACGDDGGGRPDSGPLTLDGAPGTDGRVGTDGRPATDGPAGTLCMDTCEYAGDGACDDGGPDSMFSVCDFGTDCMDCGARNPADCVPDCEGATCGSDGCGGTCGACAAGDMCSFGECITCGCDGIGCGMDPCGMMDCGTCTAPAVCYDEQCRMPMCMGRECGRDGAGGQCGTMSGGCASGMGCRDGDCVACDCGTRECGDDGCGEACGTMMGMCPMGETCDELSGMCAAMHPAGCNNTCAYPGDGECDDGRPGSHTDLCEPGTDCADCGPMMAM